MSLATLYSRARAGVDAPLVCVEVHLANGLPALNIVGLPEAAVKESKDRVRSALVTSGFEFPARRITINLAPADLPKEGGRFDLPIALGVLAASGQIPHEALERCEFIGELALSGALRPVKGVLPVAIAAREAARSLVVPEANGAEAALAEGGRVFVASHLMNICAHFSGGEHLPVAQAPKRIGVPEVADLAEVRGQAHVKRALEIAAAGAHNLLMLGPPGTGKSMLAARMPGILPPMSEAEAMESAATWSVSEAGFVSSAWGQRPFRSPHHTASGVALVGGGSNPRPGEISLAHHGVMFLDELPEFNRGVLEVLREPLESGHITISRAARQAVFPARFQLIAAMNPCPCGYFGDEQRQCRCTPDQIARYRGRISGPLLDRIDMHVEVPRLPTGVLTRPSMEAVDSSADVRTRVTVAREHQLARSGCANQFLGGEALAQVCRIDSAGRRLMEQAMQRLGLSARAYHRILRVARTIADLAQIEAIGLAHLSEAIGYRRLDRGGL